MTRISRSPTWTRISGRGTLSGEVCSTLLTTPSRPAGARRRIAAMSPGEPAQSGSGCAGAERGPGMVIKRLGFAAWLAIGVALALALSHADEPVRNDRHRSVTFATVVGVLGAVAIAASYFPRDAPRIPPVEAPGINDTGCRRICATPGNPAVARFSSAHDPDDCGRRRRQRRDLQHRQRGAGDRRPSPPPRPRAVTDTNR